MENDSEQDTRKSKSGSSLLGSIVFNILFPLFLLLGFTFSIGSIYIVLFILLYALYNMHISMDLIFDGLTEYWSRFGLSHNHPIINGLLNITFFVLVLGGFSSLALFMKSYSLHVLSRKDKVFRVKSVITFLQAVIMFLLAISIVIYIANSNMGE